ncbi:MAG TPA: hypothetical protein VGU63_10275 [Candidatus Acidoferrales bacterium]|nr:hypothetical protein [Candidatus Acidoferrales bacterium]
MPDLTFNRQAFANPTTTPPKSSSGGIAVLILVLAILACGVIGYKVIGESTPNVPKAGSQSLAQVQQQLTDIEKRLEKLEKRSASRPVAVTPSRTSGKPDQIPEMTRPAQPIIRGAAANTASDRTASSTPRDAKSSAVPALASPPAQDKTADREAWQATANQLADVVGTVGSQQDEISRDKAQLGQLVAQTRRTAIPFELHRGANPQPVGPVSMQLKKSDSKNQRYTVCVYVQDKCVELKDRVANEVVDLALAADAASLRFVATEVRANSIRGYLEVPLPLARPRR